MNTDIQAHNRANFLAWLRANFPDLYTEAVTEAETMGGIFDNLTSAFNNVVTNVTNALPNLANTYAQYKAQSQLIKANAQRAQQGLPPLVQNAQGQWVDVTGRLYDEQDYRLAQTGGMSLASIAMIGAAVLLGLILILKKR